MLVVVVAIDNRRLVELVLGAVVAVGGAPLAAQPTGLGWHEISGTELRDVCAAEHGFPEVWGASGCAGITAAWSGAIFDTTRDRLIIFGGGHNDYYGNELYAFDVGAGALARITDPGLPIASSCTASIAGGTQPNSRHTYDGIEYIRHTDQMFVFGGSLACGPGYFGDDTWVFDFATMSWQAMAPSGPTPAAVAGILTAYDPNRRLIFLHDLAHLYAYDVETDAYTRLTSSADYFGYHLAATIDPVRRLFVIVGWDVAAERGTVRTIDISPTSDYQVVEVETTGGDALIGAIYPGLDFDPTRGQVVAWGEDSPDVVYTLDLEARVWQATTYAGGPQPVGQGTHGRFRYAPAGGVFVLMNSVDDNVFVLRLGAADDLAPAPPRGLQVE